MTLFSHKAQLISSILIVGLACGYIAYNEIVAPTKIALISFPDFIIERMQQSNSNDWIQLDKISLENLSVIDTYPLVLVHGPGVRMNRKQQEIIRKAADNGTKVYVNNIDSNLTNLEGKELDYITDLIKNRTAENYKSLFNYTRTVIDQKRIGLQSYYEAVKRPYDYFYFEEDKAHPSF